MRKIVVFIVFILFVFGVYYLRDNVKDNVEDYQFRDEFNSIDRDFWYAGEWKTLFSAYDKVKIENGKAVLKIDEIDRGPFLLSQPIELNNGDILSIKRRVKMRYANENFTGGLALFETHERELIPSALNTPLTILGNGIVLIEYVYNYDEDSERPGSDVFRVLPRNWKSNGNYRLCDSTFNKWFEEELVYNTITEQIIYKVNGNEYIVNSQKMVDDQVRVLMHGYGFGLDHTLEVDWIEINIKHDSSYTAK